VLIYLGDSTLEVGNVAVFQTLPYQLANKLGVIDTTQPDFTSSIDLFLPEFVANGFSFPSPYINFDNPDFTDPVLGFSLPTASTGLFAGTYGNFAGLPFGLKSQVNYLTKSYTVPGFAEAYTGADVVMWAGSIDIFQFVNSTGQQFEPSVLSALNTKTKKDDKALTDQITGMIVGNMMTSIHELKPYVGDIVVIGAAPIEQTPFALGLASSVDPITAQKMTTFVGDIVSNVNKELIKEVKKEKSFRKSVEVIDGKKLYESIVVYDDIPGNSIPDLQSYFVDSIHFTDQTSGLFAHAIAAQICQSFGSFGL